jgi:3-dehydroquinate synthase
VICDTNTLDTLPEEIFLDGCAEVIKYAVLYDESFFASLEQTGPGFDRETVIARCVEMKRKAVMADEFDTGARMLLNLGHTLGHGVEAGSHFTLSHGKAVAIGMAMVARASSCPEADRIEALLAKFRLPTRTVLPSQIILDCALADKKRSGDTVNLILPEKIGACAIVPTSVDSLLSFIEAGY